MPKKQQRIPGGYILLSRKLIEHHIMNKPPLFLKIWVWLLLKAQHKDHKDLKRGQVRTSIPEIQEAMSYYVGYRKVKPGYKEVRQVLDWMRQPDMEEAPEGTTKGNTKGTMIGITKGRHTITVTICNYSVYQAPASYEGHDEGHDEIHAKELRKDSLHYINKNDKNESNIYSHAETIAEIIHYLNQRTGKNYRPTSDHAKRHITARLNEGYKLEDFKRVVDIKTAEWLGDAKMEKFLRPQTLFGPKFDAYLNQKGGRPRGPAKFDRKKFVFRDEEDDNEPAPF